MEIAKLYITLAADASSYQGTLQQVDRDTQSWASGLADRISKTLGTAILAAVAAIGIAIGGFFASAVDKAADLEAQMDTVAALLGATAEQAELLRQATIDLALDPQLKVSATEAAEAIEMLAQNGLSVEEILGGAARATVQLANATGADFTTAARIATDAMALWGMEASDLGQVADGVTAVLVQSKFEVNDYALALAQAGGVAAAAGVSFEDFNTTLVAIAPYFASGSDAGTSYKTMLQRLVPMTNTAKDAMAALGLITEEGGNAFFDSEGNMRSMAEVAGILHGALGGLSEQQRLQALSTIFGTDAMRAAVAMSQFTTEEFQRLQAVMANTSAAEIAAQRMQNFSGAMEILKGVVEGLQLQLGNVLLPILTTLALEGANLLAAWGPPLIAAFERLVTIFGEFFTNIQSGMSVWGALKSALMDIGGLFGMTADEAIAFAAGVTNVVQAIASFIGPIAQAIASFVSWKDAVLAFGVIAAWAVTSVLLPMLAPIAGIVAAVAGLALVFAAVRTAWENDLLGIRTAVEGVVETIGRFVSAFQDSFEDSGDVIGALVVAFQNLVGPTSTMGQIFLQLGEAARSVVEAVETFVQTLRDGGSVVDAFKAALPLLGDAARAAGQAIVDGLSAAIANAKVAIGEGLNALKDAIFQWAGATSWGEVGQAILDKIGEAFRNLGDRVATVGASILNWISSAVNGIDWHAVGEAIVSGIAAVIGGAVGLLAVAGTAIVNFFGGFFTNESLQAAGTGLVQALGNAISGAASGIASGLDAIRQAIFDWAGADSWGEVGQTILERIADAFRNLGDKVAELEANVFNWISSAIDGIDWRQIGESIINGIVAAISAVVGLLAAAGTAIVNFFGGFFTNEEVGPAAENLISSLGNAISELAGGIVDGLESIQQTIFDWAGAEDWGGVAEKIVEMVGKALGTAAAAIADQLGEWQTAIFDWAGTEDWGGVAEKIVEMVGKALGTAAAAIADQLGEWQTAIFDWAGVEDWSGVAEKIVEMVGKALGTAAAAIADQLGEWQTAIFDWAGVEDWTGVGLTIAEKVGLAAADETDNLVAKLTEWKTGLIEWAEKEDWSEAGLSMVLDVIDGLGEFANEVGSKVSEWLGDLNDEVERINWYEVGYNIVYDAAEGLGEFVGAAREKVEEWTTGLAGEVEKVDWKATADAILKGITDKIADISAFLTTTLPGWIAQFRTQVEGMTWGEVALAILAGIVAKLFGIDAVPGADLGASVTAWKDAIKAKVQEKVAEFNSIGADIIAGIAAGISSGLGAIQQAIQGIIDGAILGFNAGLDRHSPAGIMIPIGYDIPAGVAVGILQNVGAVIAAIQQVAQAVKLEGVKAFGEAMKAIAEGVASAISAILDIGSFQGAGEGFGAAMQALVDMMTAMVAAVAAANTYTVEVLENLGTFVEAAGDINDLLVQTADVVDYIGRWRTPDIAAANGSLQLLVGFLAQMVQGIVDLNLEAALILGELGGFLDSAADLPALFMGVADIVSYLAGWRAPGLGPVIDNIHVLAGLLGELVAAVAGANTMGLGMLDILATFVETAAGIVALIAPLADAMRDIATFPAGAELAVMQGNIETMASYLGQIVTAVAGANTMGALSLELLGTFVEVAADIVGLIAPMAQAMLDLANFPQGTDVQVMARNIETMAGYLRELVAAIAESNTWGQLSLELLDTFVQVAGSIAELITPLAEAIWNIANFQPPDLFTFIGNVSTIANHLAEMVAWFNSGVNYSLAALDALGQYVEVVTAIAEGMTGFIDALAAIAAFEPPDFMTFLSAIATIAGHLAEMVAWFNNGVNLSQAALDALSQYIEIMTAIAEGMTAFIDAIYAVVAFEPPDFITFIAAVASIANHLAEMVAWFYSGLNYSMAALAALGQYVEVMGDLVDLIADAIEALGLIAAYSSDTAALGPALSAFAADLMLLVQTLATAFSSASAAALAAILAAGDFADAVGDILDVVEDGVAALAALAGYVTSTGLARTVQQFAADLVTVTLTLVDALKAAGILANEAVTQAGEMAGALEDLVSVVEPAVEAVVLLVGYTTVGGLQTNVRQFAADLVIVVQTLVEGLRQAGLLANEAVAEAGEMAKAIEDILKVVEPALHPDKGALSLIAKYVSDGALLQKAQAFTDDLIAVTQTLVAGLTMSALAAGVALAKAGEMGKSMKDLFDAIKPAVDTIDQIANYTSAANLAAKTQQFVSDILTVATILVTGLVTAANQLSAEAVSAAHAFAQAVGLIASRLLAVVESMSAMGSLPLPNIGPVLTYLTTSTQQIVAAMMSTGDIGQAVQYAENFRANLQQLVVEVQAAVAALNQIAGAGTSGSIGAALANIADSLSNAEGQFAGAGDALANALIDALRGGIDGGEGEVVQATVGVLGAALNAGLSEAREFTRVGDAVIDAMVDGVLGGQAQVVAAVVQVVRVAIAAGISEARGAAEVGRQVIQAALAEINAGRGQLDAAGAAAGTAIIDGMVRAITSGKSRLVNAIKDAVEAAVKAAQAALGIASPSRVAFELFGNFMRTAEIPLGDPRGLVAAIGRSTRAMVDEAARAVNELGRMVVPAMVAPVGVGAQTARLTQPALGAGTTSAAAMGPRAAVAPAPVYNFYGDFVVEGVQDGPGLLEQLAALTAGARR